MFPEDDLEHVELDAALDVDVLGLACAEGFARERVVLDAGVGVEDAAKHRILVHVQRHRPVDDVREVEIHYVVTRYDIRVDLDKEIAPSLQQLLLGLERVDLTADYGRTGVQSEHVTYKRLSFALHLHNICNLNDRILLGLRKFALFGGAFNVK